MLQRAAALGVAPASYRPVGDALAAAVRQDMALLFADAERWAVMAPHAREALVRRTAAGSIVPNLLWAKQGLLLPDCCPRTDSSVTAHDMYRLGAPARTLDMIHTP